jgi:Arf-GAP/coiled-coil/ANK repeat/PH domain-containing protein
MLACANADPCRSLLNTTYDYYTGPVMTKFTIALREIGTYKEVLRSQVEHMLNDRLTQFVSIDLQDVKEVRKRFDKASLHYDQVREKFLSLRKDAKVEVVSEAQEDLWNAKSQFEQARFNLVGFPLQQLLLHQKT